MLSLKQDAVTESRPQGIVAIAILLLAQAAVSMGFAGLLFAGYASLSAGAVLLGGGLEQLGPIVFLVQAVIAALLAAGLWKRWRWSRLAAIVYCAAGVLMGIPAISSAVVDTRSLAILREGLQIIVRVVVIYYLCQEPVRDWFAS